MRFVVLTCIVVALIFSGVVAVAADEKADKPADNAANTVDKHAEKEDSKKEEAPKFIPQGDLEQGSYALGVDIGRNFSARKMDLDVTAFLAGMRAAMEGEKLALSENELREAMIKFNTRLRAKDRERKIEQARKNATEGAAFLAANAKKEGVVTLPSGLQYKVIHEGDGPSPKPTDMVTTNYRGSFIDGTEFDSSYERGQPAEFRVNQVIKGWTEALQLMKVGSKWELFVPSELAYGAEGRGPSMPPNATLVFEVELLGIKGMDAESK